MEEHRPKKLLGQVRNEIRLKHHRTQQAWTRCVEHCTLAPARIRQ